MIIFHKGYMPAATAAKAAVPTAPPMARHLCWPAQCFALAGKEKRFPGISEVGKRDITAADGRFGGCRTRLRLWNWDRIDFWSGACCGLGLLCFEHGRFRSL